MMHTPKCTVAIVLTLAVSLGLSSCSSSKHASTSQRARRPNIVFIYTDDLDDHILQDNAALFPNFHALIERQGTTFDNSFVSDSLCCPSRSTMLRGQYDHNTGVLGNVPPQGGFERFHALGREQSTIATWLHAAGYATGLFGKYLNGYPNTVAPTYVPTGWDDFVSPNQGNAYQEYNYSLNVNGTTEAHGRGPADYLTDVIGNYGIDFMRSHAASQPFFAVLSTYAPHLPAVPAPQYANTASALRAPRTPSFNEADVSDKPKYLRDSPPLTTSQIAILDDVYRHQVESMRSVDDLIGRVVNALQDLHQLDNTYIFFSSDNGYHLGQHRLLAGKLTPYDEDIRVPLAVRGPGVRANAHVPQLADNTDLAPTFAALARASVPGFVDGRSLTPLFETSAPPQWRNAVFLEHSDADSSGALSRGLDQYLKTHGGKLAPASTSSTIRSTTTTVQANPDVPEQIAGLGGASADSDVIVQFIPSYKGIRTATFTYVEDAGGDREYYDTVHDPFELTNIAGRLSGSYLTALHSWLVALAGCKADSCRAQEDSALPPQS